MAQRRGKKTLTMATLGLWAAACSEPPPSSGPRSAAPNGATTVLVAPSAAASQSASVATAVPGWAGAYSGAYDAKKTEIALEKGVADRAWKKEDGKAASGPGTIELEISPDGMVTGKVSGSLGPGSLSGQIEDEKVVNLTLTPTQPSDAAAMSGTVSTLLAGDELKGTLQASSADGVVVRRADVTLKRQPRP